MNTPLDEFCDRELQKSERDGLLRSLRPGTDRDGRSIKINGNPVVDFSSNDYLGISVHPQMRKFRVSMEFNSGATASRLISGNHSEYQELERALAGFKRAEASLVFSSGYAAAVGAIPALVGEGDFIVMDKLCHASLVDGARLSGATLRVFPHQNLKKCEELLKTCRILAGNEHQVLLITESVFSMDGDLAPLHALVELKHKHGAWLMVDEAHATGLLGSNGRGGCEHFDVEGHIDVSMGTLSKAIACVGGFISGSKKLKEFLVNRSRSFIFSTGLPPGVCKLAVEAVSIIQNEPEWRFRLNSNIRKLEENLQSFDLLANTNKLESPIIPIIIGDEHRCLQVADEMLKKGFFTPAVRYPTVKKGSARLRVSVSASHLTEDLDAFSKALFQSVGKQSL